MPILKTKSLHNNHSRHKAHIDFVYTSVYTFGMTTKVQKWGNSLAVRLPKHLARAASFKAGTPVVITRDRRGIMVMSKSVPEPTLEELIAQITPENRYEKIDWGPRRGNEIW